VNCDSILTILVNLPASLIKCVFRDTNPLLTQNLSLPKHTFHSRITQQVTPIISRILNDQMDEFKESNQIHSMNPTLLTIARLQQKPDHFNEMHA
jgi:hypothetical protein